VILPRFFLSGVGVRDADARFFGVGAADACCSGVETADCFCLAGARLCETSLPDAAASERELLLSLSSSSSRGPAGPERGVEQPLLDMAGEGAAHEAAQVVRDGRCAEVEGVMRWSGRKERRRRRRRALPGQRRPAVRSAQQREGGPPPQGTRAALSH
jgi:hypothetical protein